MTAPAEERVAELERLLRTARAWVEESGLPGRYVLITEASARRSREVLAEIDTALGAGSG